MPQRLQHQNNYYCIFYKLKVVSSLPIVSVIFFILSFVPGLFNVAILDILTMAF